MVSDQESPEVGEWWSEDLEVVGGGIVSFQVRCAGNKKKL